MYKYLVELSIPKELSPNKDYLSLVNHYKGLPWMFLHGIEIFLVIFVL